MRLKRNDGLSLVELVIALSLLSVVLAIAYGFYTFGSYTFASGEKQSNLQQAISLATDYVSRELRYATRMTILTDTSTIPPDSAIGADEYYVFINNNNEIELRQRNLTKVLFNPVQYGMNFELLTFNKADSKVLELTITGNRLNDTNKKYTIDTKILAENMNLSTEQINGPLSGPGIRFSKNITYTPPAYTNTSVLVSPNVVTVSPTFNVTFELTLTGPSFMSSLQTNQFSLGSDFGGLTIANVTRVSDTKATIQITGNLTHIDGIGIINISQNVLNSGNALIAGVIVESNIRRLTMAVRPSNGGTVSPAVGTSNRTLGEVVSITATHTSPWQFRHWLINGQPFSGANRTVEMEDHVAATAVFMIPLSQIRGGNYIEYNGIKYLKLKSPTPNNRVLHTTISESAQKWPQIQPAHKSRLPLRSELEGDDWTSARRSVATTYWTGSDWGSNHKDSVKSNGEFDKLHTSNNETGAVLLTEDLGTGLFATDGNGTFSQPYILFRP